MKCARTRGCVQALITVCPWNVACAHVVYSCQSKCVHGMLQALMLYTAVNQKYVHGMLQALMLFTSCQSNCLHGMLQALILSTWNDINILQ